MTGRQVFIRFVVNGYAFSLGDMLAQNASDESFCRWLRNARVGDEYLEGEGCLRIEDGPLGAPIDPAEHSKFTIVRNGRTERFDYFALRTGEYGGVDILGWGEYPDSSVLAGQPMKCFLDNVADEAAARAWIVERAGTKAAEHVGWSSKWTDPVVSLSHLPGEDDPVAGGAYPDDI